MDEQQEVLYTDFLRQLFGLLQKLWSQLLDMTAVTNNIKKGGVWGVKRNTKSVVPYQYDTTSMMTGWHSKPAAQKPTMDCVFSFFHADQSQGLNLSERILMTTVTPA